MDTEQKIKQLERQVQELLTWKEQRTRQQIVFPLDKQSIDVLNKDVLVKKTTETRTKVVGIENTFIASNSIELPAGLQYRTIIGNGENTIDFQGKANESKNTILILENQPNDTTKQSLFYGYRKPQYVSVSPTAISVTSGGNTLTDTTKSFATNELAGAFVNIYSGAGDLQFTRQISSNTSTVITIDGTWSATVNNGGYLIFMPILLGSSDTPWSSLYSGGLDVSAGGDGSIRRVLRMGYGTRAGADVISIFFGTGSPESVVTANVGSLFLRTDGSTSTTLYVKTSGTSNTGWTAK